MVNAMLSGRIGLTGSSVNTFSVRLTQD